MELKANERPDIKHLVALLYDKRFGFYRKARIKYRCSPLHSFVSAWSNHLVVIWSCDPYFLPNRANSFCSIFRLSQVTNRLVVFIRGWYAPLQVKAKELNEFFTVGFEISVLKVTALRWWWNVRLMTIDIVLLNAWSIFVKIFWRIRLHESVNRSHLIHLRPIWAILERDSNLQRFRDGCD